MGYRRAGLNEIRIQLIAELAGQVSWPKRRAVRIFRRGQRLYNVNSSYNQRSNCLGMFLTRIFWLSPLLMK